MASGVRRFVCLWRMLRLFPPTVGFSSARAAIWRPAAVLSPANHINAQNNNAFFGFFLTQSLDMNGPSPYLQVAFWHSLGGSAKVNLIKIQSLGD
jgi:hypothetical protein